MFSTMNILEHDLLPIEDVAKELGVDVKRLRGYIHRNGITDPIGSLAMDQVYGWSCKALVARLAASSTSSEVVK